MYTCSNCGRPLTPSAVICNNCGLHFVSPVPQNASVDTNRPIPKNQPISWGVASGNSPIRKRSIPYIIWCSLLIIICIGALTSAFQGDMTGFWILLVLGGPTLWFMRNWPLRTKLIAGATWLILALVFGAYSLTPAGKASYAAKMHEENVEHQREGQAQKSTAGPTAKPTTDQAETTTSKSVSERATNSHKMGSSALRPKNPTRQAALSVTALPGHRVQVSGTTTAAEDNAILISVEEKPTGFSGQTKAPVTNGVFQTEAFGPDGGLTPGFYTIDVGYGDTVKKGGFELRPDGSVIMTTARSATSHARPRIYGHYPMVSRKTYGNGTAERAVAEFLVGWKRHDWDEMLNATQVTWQSDQKQPRQWLKDIYGDEDIMGTKITASSAVSEYVRDITFTVYVKDENGNVEQRTTVGRVLREEGPMSLSSSGKWGVNPISTINSGGSAGL